jgi:hypothetical protein
MDWYPDSYFRLVDLGELVFIETDSDGQIQAYRKYDAPWVSQLLEEDRLESEELETEWWDPEQAA